MRRTPVPENWVTQLHKGVLELCVLNAVRSGRMYGYDIVRRLREMRGLMIREGSVYPILSRLKGDGYLSASIEESAEGPPRKCYQLTGEGLRLLDEMNAHWFELGKGIDSLLREEST